MTAIETAANLENLNRITNTIDDSKYMPVFPKASRLLLNSGNVVSSDRLKKRTNLNPEEEVTPHILFISHLDFFFQIIF